MPGRDVSAVLPTGLGKCAIYQLISKVWFRMGRTANATSKTTVELFVSFLLAYKVERYLHQVLLQGRVVRKAVKVNPGLNVN